MTQGIPGTGWMTAAILLYSVFLQGCGNPGKDVAGTSTQTTNGISGQILAPDSTPIAEALVTLYSASTGGRTATTTTAKDGYFHVVDSLNPDAAGWRLEAVSQDSGLMMWSWHEANDSSAGNTRKWIAQASSSLLPTDTTAGWALLGTPYHARSAMGFRHLPAGAFTLAQESENGLSIAGSLDLRPASVIHYVAPEDSGVLLDDFNDGDLHNALSPLSGGGTWYTNGLTASVQADMVTGERVLSASAGNGGSLSLLGTRLGMDGVGYDMTKLTGMRMRVRGDALLEIGLEGPLTDSIGNNFKALWVVSSDSSWTTVELHPGEEYLSTSYSYQVPLASIAADIGTFTVFVIDGSWFQIDDIRFDGVSLAEFTP